jgi:hypothetical protein
MASPRARARPSLRIARSFERSRLDEQLMAAAYELVLPVVRRSLTGKAPAERTPETDKADRQTLRTAGGLGV